MTTAWLICAAVLAGQVTICGLVAARRRTLEALVAMELAGALATVLLVCLAVGYQRSTYGNVPIIAAVLTWIGGLIYVRFLSAKKQL